MTKLSKAYRRWLKRLATGKISDREWPLGVDSRGRLRTEMPAIRIVTEAEAEELARRPLPLP